MTFDVIRLSTFEQKRMANVLFIINFEKVSQLKRN